MKKILVILGPTATGKTDLALNLAKKYNGELVSCDSRQVYKGLDIGTGKEPGKRNKYQVLRVNKGEGWWDVGGIRIWMLDVVEPHVQYTVANYVKQAWKVIERVESRGKVPVVVGGTGLYLKALLDDLPNLSIPIDKKLRGELEQLSKEQLQEKLKKLSLKKFASLNNSEKNNPRRLLRSIELILMYGHGRKTQISKLKSQNYDVLKIGLKAPREVLNYRIDQRLLARLDQGLIREAKQLYENGLSFQRMRQLGLEYGCLADLLEEKINYEDFVEKLKSKIHRYAKRQMVWFKKNSGCINWFDITGENWQQQVEKTVHFWYDEGNDETY